MKARWLLTQMAWLSFLALSACIEESTVAGGSSGVDNPQIEVAFTSSTGTSVTATGSLSIYSANQNPALDPNPIVQVHLDNDSSIQLSSQDFLPTDSGGDTAQAYNVLLIGDDSTGALLQSLTYNPKTRKFSAGGDSVSKIRMPLVPLVNYVSSLQQNGINPERVFIPGTPFQAVVVDSGFTFSQIPAGSFPLRLITDSGIELQLPDSLNTQNTQPHRVDTAASPIVRPPPPPPPKLQVNAGPDQNVFLGSQAFLSGQVTGVSSSDPQLAIVWNQINPNPQTVRANIANPTALSTTVSFPKPGAYIFVLSAAFGTNPPKQDTVLIGVQPASPAAFIEPDGDTIPVGKPFNVIWNGHRPESLSLQLSVNGGSTWNVPAIATAIQADSGLNTYSWTPVSAATNCLLRLVGGGDTLLSARFTLSAH